MVDYLKIARRVRKQEPRSAPATDLQGKAPEARKLLAAGWKPKERCGKTIWESRDNGFYYSQEMAIHFLGRGIGNAGCKSGANGRG